MLRVRQKPVIFCICKIYKDLPFLYGPVRLPHPAVGAD